MGRTGTSVSVPTTGNSRSCSSLSPVSYTHLQPVLLIVQTPVFGIDAASVTFAEFGLSLIHICRSWGRRCWYDTNGHRSEYCCHRSADSSHRDVYKRQPEYWRLNNKKNWLKKKLQKTSDEQIRKSYLYEDVYKRQSLFSMKVVKIISMKSYLFH